MNLKQRKLNQNTYLNGKKGNAVLDTIGFILVIFFLAVAIFYALPAFNDLNTDIQADQSYSNTSKEAVDDIYTRYPAVFDNIFVLVLVLLIAFLLIASYLIDTSPVFFIMSIVLLIGLLYIGATLTNSFEDIADDDYLSISITGFPKTYFIMTHLVEVILALSLLVGGVLFAKS